MDFPITRSDQLPPVGTSRESSLVDFKSQLEPTKPFEMAKDIAAFANSSGGTLLIGAREQNHCLGRYEPLTEAQAAEAKIAYGLQVTQRCSPAPLIEIAILPKEPGFVVAVNVWPFPGQPVGVLLHGDKVKDGHGGEGFAFPLRIGVDTVWIQPEQLPMLMLPDVRRVAILLDQISEEKRKAVQVFYYSKNGVLMDQTFSLLSVRPMENVAAFENNNELHDRYPTMPPSSANRNLHIPLDAMKRVWSGCEGDWCVMMGSGSIDRTSEGWLAFFP